MKCTNFSWVNFTDFSITNYQFQIKKSVIYIWRRTLGSLTLSSAQSVTFFSRCGVGWDREKCLQWSKSQMAITQATTTRRGVGLSELSWLILFRVFFSSQKLVIELCSGGVIHGLYSGYQRRLQMHAFSSTPMNSVLAPCCTSGGD